MYKKLISAVTAAAMLLGSSAVPVSELGGRFADIGSIAASAETLTYGDFEYSIIDGAGTIEIMRYIGNDSVVEIPAAIDGKTVTRIGDASFYYCSFINEVSLPYSIYCIEQYAFYGCEKS